MFNISNLIIYFIKNQAVWQKKSFDADVSEIILEISFRTKKKSCTLAAWDNVILVKLKLDAGDAEWQNSNNIALLENELDQCFIFPCICKSKINLIQKS